MTSVFLRHRVILYGITLWSACRAYFQRYRWLDAQQLMVDVRLDVADGTYISVTLLHGL